MHGSTINDAPKRANKIGTRSRLSIHMNEDYELALPNIQTSSKGNGLGAVI